MRVDKVIERIGQLPDAESEFAYEINLLGKVAGVMGEATGILARPETGSEAIAAETEAIELLLRSRRINPGRWWRRRQPGRRRHRQDRRFGHGPPGIGRQPERGPRGPRRLAGDR